MSHLLWKSYWENDVDRFRRLLAPAGSYPQTISRSPGVNVGGHLGGSPGAHGTSPKIASRNRRTSGYTPTGPNKTKDGNATLGRNEVNSRDHVGLTILHRAASSTAPEARAFVQALIDHPAIDLYARDPESGWNALHLSLYSGNVSIARMLLEKEREFLTSHDLNTVSKAGTLIKTKDHEGMSPFDIYNATIATRSLQVQDDEHPSDSDSESEDSVVDGSHRTHKLASTIHSTFHGDELYVFGSNKNLTLGVGDEDDRQFPERIQLRRPDALLFKMYEMFCEEHAVQAESSLSLDDIPTLVRNRPIVIEAVVMSKLHSAVLTTDPVLNMYICGVGRGGRLGLGDENTQFRFTPVQGPLSDRRVHHVALGQNHTLAVAGNGELWTWGLNVDSQLGYVLPPPTRADEEPMCVTPRQVFGPLKKEVILGVAASAIHSVAHTGSSLFCWGRNVGQLALMDADSRSLEVQQTPRKVAASLLSAPIVMISAIDKATICLLSNHAVWVFAHYGYNLVKFPVPDVFANYNIAASFSNQYDPRRRKIDYITAGGDMIAAVTAAGDLFTMQLNQHEVPPPAMSTTNPVKIKGALTQPQCIWDSRKDGVASVNVGEHSSVIICTESGAVWKRARRFKGKGVKFGEVPTNFRRKDFKFERVPYITNCVASRGSTFGALAAIRKDSKVMSNQMEIGGKTIWDDLSPLLCLSDFEPSELGDEGSFGDSRRVAILRGQRPGSTAHQLLRSTNIESDLLQWLASRSSTSDNTDLDICTASMPTIKLPVHSWMLGARSSVLRAAFAACREHGCYADPDYFSIDINGPKMLLAFVNVDIYTLLNIVVHAYQDALLPVWRLTREAPGHAPRFRQVRNEVMRLATRLHLSQLETAARLQTGLARSLDADFHLAISDSRFFDDADVTLELDGADIVAHSQLLCQRCPFFEGMFFGRSGGGWLTERRDLMSSEEKVCVDLKHMSPDSFRYVLEFMYADVGAEMFKNVVSGSIDEFSELILDVMGIANELMLDRLSQICQSLIGKFVTTNNISVLLNEISPCAVTDFKVTGLEYICLQLEAMLENHLLDSLDEELIHELDDVVRSNQLARFPFARSGRAEQLLYEQDPYLAMDIEEERAVRIREMAYKFTQRDDDRRLSSSYRARFGSLDDFMSSSPTADRSRRKSKTAQNEPFSPSLRPQTSQADLMFDMDDEEYLKNGNHRSPRFLDNIGSLKLDSELMSQLPKTWSRVKSQELDNSYTSPNDSPRDPMSQSPQPDGIGTPDAPRGSRPWASTTLQIAKLDLKGIMTEATSKSALSAGLAAQKADGMSISNKPQTKMSQKERKKQVQVQVEAQATEQKQQEAHAPWEKVEERPRPAPWMEKMPAVQTSLKDAMTSELSAREAIRAKNKSPLATGMSPQVNKARTCSPDTRFSGQGRTTSSPAVPSAPDSKSSKKPLMPHSKSYMPPAPRFETDLGGSMADIIGQQRREQELVKEAVAKRSLQEIQQEQEFQNWWDQETRRIQEEESRKSVKAKSKDEKAGQRGRRGRGGKAKTNETGNPPAQQSGSTALKSEGSSTRPRGGRSRGRKAQA